MRWILPILGLLIVGCAATPKLDEYPRREIDRPFNLPHGVTTWSTLGIYSREKFEDGIHGDLVDDHFIPAIPFFWRQSLSDRWNLIWAPLPVGATMQIRNDESATTGLSLGYGLKISSYGYSAAALAVGYFHRQRLSSSFAVEVQPTLTPWIPVGKKAEWDFQGSFSVGSLLQLAETVALRAGVRPVVRRDSQTVIRGSLFDDDGLEISTDYQWRVVLPVYAGFTWSAGRQWDFVGSAEYQKIGETLGYSNLQLTYELRHYW